jgi:oxygen-independent coproporphyrinogen-3 oxidase
VNRVSLGVQSFVDRECAAVGRLHTGQDCVREIARLRAAGVAGVGADLIAGLPYQTQGSFRESMETAAAVGLTHLSVYMLEVDEDSRLGREVLAGGLRLHAPNVPVDDEAAAMYEMACAWLPEHGFAQYEISNFAAVCGAGCHRSRHNVKYWKRAPYVGFGLDAHSMLLTDEGAVRFANVDELGQYGRSEQAAGLSTALRSGRDDRLFVGAREAFEETVFLGLRMNEGVDVEGLRAEFAQEWVWEFEESARELVREGLMVEEDGCWRLTLRGRLVSNEVFGALLERVAA